MAGILSGRVLPGGGWEFPVCGMIHRLGFLIQTLCTYITYIHYGSLPSDASGVY